MLTITIDTANAAFDPDPAPELVRILATITGRVADGCRYEDQPIYDGNGNRVGTVNYEPGGDAYPDAVPAEHEHGDQTHEHAYGMADHYHDADGDTFYADDLRSCDECGRLEDAGTYPDQDGLGRSVCCAGVSA